VTNIRRAFDMITSRLRKACVYYLLITVLFVMASCCTFVFRARDRWSRTITNWDGRTFVVKMHYSRCGQCGNGYCLLYGGGGEELEAEIQIPGLPPMSWEGSALPIAIQSEGDMIYIVSYRRDSRLVFERFTKQSVTWEEIEPTRMPKYMAVQNAHTWLYMDNPFLKFTPLNDSDTPIVSAAQIPHPDWHRLWCISFTAHMWSMVSGRSANVSRDCIDPSFLDSYYKENILKTPQKPDFMHDNISRYAPFFESMVN